MNLLKILKKEGILLDFNAYTKDEVIDLLVDVHDKLGNLNDREEFKKAILDREAITSTGLERGIAIPHAKTSAVKELSLVVGRAKTPIDYSAHDGNPSNLFFMIAAQDDANPLHMKVLQKLSKYLMDDEFKTKMEIAKEPQEVIDAILEMEEGPVVNKKIREEVVREVRKECPEQPLEKSKNLEKKTKETMKGTAKPYDIVAVTACPTGIAHTFISKEALEKIAREKGLKIKVETNGANGVENRLSEKEIEEARGVIIAADRKVELDRFDGKHTAILTIKDVLNNGREIMDSVYFQKVPKYRSKEPTLGTSSGKGPYKHLMSGLSFVLPIIVAGGILAAIALLVDSLAGNVGAGIEYGTTSPLANAIMEISDIALTLYLPILSGYIAHSIAEKPALASGLIAGALASSGGGGFIGAIIGGFLSGYITKAVIVLFKKLPKSLNGLKSILIYPLLSVLLTGLLMHFIFNPPVAIIDYFLNEWLENLHGASAILAGATLGAMMAIDMGGPVNKSVYVFATGTLATAGHDGSEIMAAVMAGGMVPPLAIGIASTFFKSKFNSYEKEVSNSNYIMGLSFITEGAIPFVLSDPVRVAPIMMIGSAITGALTMYFDVTLPVPHGGFLVMFLSNKVTIYILSLLIGAVVSGVLFGLFKNKSIEKNQPK